MLAEIAFLVALACKFLAVDSAVVAAIKAVLAAINLGSVADAPPAVKDVILACCLVASCLLDETNPLCVFASLIYESLAVVAEATFPAAALTFCCETATLPLCLATNAFLLLTVVSACCLAFSSDVYCCALFCTSSVFCFTSICTRLSSLLGSSYLNCSSRVSFNFLISSGLFGSNLPLLPRPIGPPLANLANLFIACNFEEPILLASCGLYTYSPGVSNAGTTPPLANLEAFAKLSAPILLTEDFLITKEPSGKSIGTVSELPFPGTNPPDANLNDFRFSAKFSLAIPLLRCLEFNLNLTLALSLAASLNLFILSALSLNFCSCV